MCTYEEVTELLKENNQLQVLRFYDELDQEQRKKLLKQIKEVDFSILKLVEDREKEIAKGKITPLTGTVTVDEIKKREEEYRRVGLDAIRKCEVGAVLLAGGQGTRLGSAEPKGMYNIGINQTLYIFEMQIRNLMKVVEESGVWIPLMIMTSVKNDAQTREFFKEHDYFGYDPEYVMFFVQEMAPAVDYNGKLYLEEKDSLALSPNGNGGWFSSMKKSGILDKAKKMGVKWLNVYAVDNVLQKMADPLFVGATILSGYPVGSKVVRKAAPDEKVGVLCKEDGKPSIVEYYELTDEMMEEKNADGELAYNFGVILNYLFRVEDLETIADKHLPLHIVEKKIPYVNEEGEKIKPDQPNGYKFENLVLDMIHMLDDCLAYEVVRNKEFAPVKNKEGVDSVESARKLLIENGVEL